MTPNPASQTRPAGSSPRPRFSRRQLLQYASNGFGALALTALFGRGGGQTLAGAPGTVASETGIPHVPPRVRSVIFLFMEGAVSQVDSFDYKPMLARYHGKDPRMTIGKIEKTQFENIGTVFKSPWNFKRHGQSGLWISDLFPHMAALADELCVIRSMTSNFPEHTSANYFLHSGLGLQGRPSMGAWVNYGLGSENENLPGYVVLNGGRFRPVAWTTSAAASCRRPIRDLSSMPSEHRWPMWFPASEPPACRKPREAWSVG